MAEANSSRRPEIVSSASNKKTILIIIVVFGILAIFGLAGYLIQETSDTTTNTEKTSETVNGNQKESTVETENGTITLKEGEAPKNLPKDVTLYEGASVERSTEGADGVSVILKTDDPSKKVVNFYKEDLKEKSWNSIEVNTIKGSSLVTAEKKNKQLILTVTTDENDGKTSIAIVVGNK